MTLFHNREESWPKNHNDLGLKKEFFVDAVSGEPFIWANEEQRRQEGFKVIWQPRSFRTRLFPFGEKRQYAIYSDGALCDFLHRED